MCGARPNSPRCSAPPTPSASRASTAWSPRAISAKKPRASTWARASSTCRKPLAEAAAREGVDLKPTLAAWRETLRAARDGRRVWPERDDKVLTSWNGLMIAGLARAGHLLDEPAWVRAAGEAADFALRELRAEGRLLAVWRAGQAKLAATLDDHAFLALGLLELHAATGESSRLDAARALADALLARFADPAGGFYYTAAEEPVLLARRLDPYDGALPSGNGVAVRVLLRLAAAAPEHEARYREAARACLNALAPAMLRVPRGTLSLIAALAADLAGAAAAHPAHPEKGAHHEQGH